MKWIEWLVRLTAGTRHEIERNDDMAGKGNKSRDYGISRNIQISVRGAYGVSGRGRIISSVDRDVKNPPNPIPATLAHSDHYCRNVQSKAVCAHKLYHSTMQGGKYR